MDISIANTVASVLTTSVAMGEGALAGGATGGSSGAINGALIGGATDMNNRKLHQNEKDMLEILKKGKTTAEQDKLDAAACYLTHCEAEYPIGSDKYNTEKAKYDFGATLAAEQNVLRGTGLFTYTTGRLSSLPDSLGGIVPDSAMDEAARQMANTQKIQNAQAKQQTQEVKTKIADAAAKASTQLGRAAAVSTVVGTIGAAEGDPVWTVAGYSGAGVFTAAGYVAGGVEQLMRPNMNQVLFDSFVDKTVKGISDRYPLWSIPVNEVGNAIKDSDAANKIKAGK